MSKKCDNRKDMLYIYLEEYKSVRCEAIQRLDIQHKMVNYITILLAPVIASLTILSPQPSFVKAAPVVLLLLPIIFAPLCFSYLKNAVIVMSIRKYVQQVLRPKVSSLLGADQIFEWDTYHVQGSKGLRSIISAISHCVEAVPIIIPTIAFFILFGPPRQTYQLLLLIVDAVLALAVVALNIWAAFYFLGTKPPKKYIYPPLH